MSNVAIERQPAVAVYRDRPAPVVVRPEGLTAETAGEALGTLEHGCRLFLLSKGAVSLTDLIGEVLRQMGGADLLFIASWTIASDAIATLRGWLDSGLVRTLRVLVDPSYVVRHVSYAQELREAIGLQRVALANTHLKLAVAVNSEWAIVVSSSANLNAARRLESFAIEDSRSLAAWLLSVLPDWYVDASGSWALSRSEHSARLAAWREPEAPAVECDPVEAELLAALGRGLR